MDKMMSCIKHKYRIETMDLLIDGYKYNVQVWISVDGGENFYYCGMGKFCKTEREATEFIAWHKKENPDTEDEKDIAKHMEKVNPICDNCGKFGGECQGTTEKAWTGCIYKTSKN